MGGHCFVMHLCTRCVYIVEMEEHTRAKKRIKNLGFVTVVVVIVIVPPRIHSKVVIWLGLPGCCLLRCVWCLWLRSLGLGWRQPDSQLLAWLPGMMKIFLKNVIWLYYVTSNIYGPYKMKIATTLYYRYILILIRNTEKRMEDGMMEDLYLYLNTYTYNSLKFIDTFYKFLWNWWYCI